MAAKVTTTVANVATGQVSVGSTATLIVPSRIGAPGTGRAAVIITNIGTTDVYIGFNNTVTTGNGDLLTGTKGAFVTIPYDGAIWGIVASGSQTVSFMEVY